MRLTIPFHSYRRTYMPSSYHIVQELQKYNIPDYRPRQEQSAIFYYLSMYRDTKFGYVLGSRRRSRKFVPLSACEEIAVSHSARPRTQGNRIKPNSSERTTHQKLALVHPDIRCIATMQDVVFILHADYLIFVVICKPPDNAPTYYTWNHFYASVHEAVAYL